MIPISNTIDCIDVNVGTASNNTDMISSTNSHLGQTNDPNELAEITVENNLSIFYNRFKICTRENDKITSKENNRVLFNEGCSIQTEH
ncbi:hypothetical protein K502DRAFT_367137 [Neoconidiobolus thromboides FSU 785]|nr:hypothetical protein K502DRAFT_367137 [Neoconidiobolus thromboides FSU 785]